MAWVVAGGVTAPAGLAADGLAADQWYIQFAHHAASLSSQPEAGILSVGTGLLAIGAGMIWHASKEHRAAVTRRQQDMTQLCRHLSECCTDYRNGYEQIDLDNTRAQQFSKDGDKSWKEASLVIQSHFKASQYEALAKSLRLVRATIEKRAGFRDRAWMADDEQSQQNERVAVVDGCFRLGLGALQEFGQRNCPTEIPWS